MILATPIGQVAESNDPTSRATFLATHRAIGVLKREMARLCKDLIAGAKLLVPDAPTDAPVVRQSPDGCIVQLGPVALTISWLRNGSDAPVAGQLMAVVWRGVIAPRGDHSPERSGMRRARPTPVAVWEETCVVSATSEETWHWHPENVHREGYASPELCARLLEQLSAARTAALSDAHVG